MNRTLLYDSLLNGLAKLHRGVPMIETNLGAQSLLQQVIGELRLRPLMAEEIDLTAEVVNLLRLGGAQKLPGLSMVPIAHLENLPRPVCAAIWASIGHRPSTSEEYLLLESLTNEFPFGLALFEYLLPPVKPLIIQYPPVHKSPRPRRRIKLAPPSLFEKADDEMPNIQDEAQHG